MKSHITDFAGDLSIAMVVQAQIDDYKRAAQVIEHGVPQDADNIAFGALFGVTAADTFTWAQSRIAQPVIDLDRARADANAAHAGEGWATFLELVQ